MKQYKIPASKNNNFLDQIMKVKKIIPGPGNYVKPDNWAKSLKPMVIYTSNRKNFIDDIVKKGKATPGIGKYDTQAFDKKYNKRPLGPVKISANETANYI